MKKSSVIFLCIAIFSVVGMYMFYHSGNHKLLVLKNENKRDELLQWVDLKARQGAFLDSRNALNQHFSFIGDYSVDIDFDQGSYGFSENAVARVVVDEHSRPLSVVFIDKSLCAVAVALGDNGQVAQGFRYLPSNLKVIYPRIGFFCIERD